MFASLPYTLKHFLYEECDAKERAWLQPASQPAASQPASQEPPAAEDGYPAHLPLAGGRKLLLGQNLGVRTAWGLEKLTPTNLCRNLQFRNPSLHPPLENLAIPTT